MAEASFELLEAKLLSEEQALTLESKDKSSKTFMIEGRRSYNSNQRPSEHF
jgi:hypothetical protein